MESEIWPNIILELKNNNISFSILNGRISKKSYFFWKKISFFSKEIFSNINFCFVQNQESKNYFKNLGVPSVKLISNLKFINNSNQIDKSEYLSLKKILSKKLVITLFSCHEDEELVLINCYNNLKKKFTNLFFIIIPRHVHKRKQIMLNLKNHNINYAVRTKDKNDIKEKIPNEIHAAGTCTYIILTESLCL
jgi:3-deoxy-D-manno-octulosonic-acid transferase